MMTKQEFFDKTLAAIRAQGKPSGVLSGDPGYESRRSFACQYRGPNGLKCAAGHFITDEEYRLGMEGRAASQLPLRPEHVLLQHPSLTDSLQMAHDDAARSIVTDGRLEDFDFMIEYEHEMHRVAEAYGLDYTPPR